MNRFKRVLSVFSTGVISMSSLFVLAPTVHAVADTCTWVGGGADANFTTAGNWSGCDNSNVPEDGDALIFPSAATAYTANNDLTGASFSDITFNGTLATPTCNTNEYTITGNSFSVAGSFIFDHDGTCAITGGYTVDVDAPYVNSGPTNLVDGTQSATFDRLRLNGGATGSGTLSVRTAELDVINVNSTVNLGAEDGGWLGYQVGSCSGAVIASQLSLSGQGNRLIIYDGSAYCTAYTISSLNLSGTASVAAGYEATATVTSWVNPNSGYTVSIVDGSTSKMIVNGQTLEGAYINTTISTDESANPYTTAGKEIVTVTSTGQTGDFTVAKYGYLKGNSGIVGNLTVNAGAFLAPGNSPGCLASGNLSIAGTYEVEVQGVTACSGYDQTNVTGTVTLTGGTLDVATTAFVPSVGQTYTIINNDGVDAVTGTFNGLAEGATIVDGGVTYTISYAGGDGNDVVLTVTAVNAAAIPGAPNTGFALITANPLVALLGGLLAAAGFGLLARRNYGK